MRSRPLGRTGLLTAPLVLGGNVFGWTLDEKASFEVLDAFVDYGFNAIDTADVYSTWVPGNRGGESETIIGRWLKANPGKREKVLILTKVGSKMGEDRTGLGARWIAQAVEDSLKRLGIDRIDLYQAHFPDAATPFAETLGAFEKLLKAGKVRAIGTSNLDAGQLAQSLAVAREAGLPRYETLQPRYNLHDRSGFEAELQALCEAEGLGVIPYYGLASGFLSGKYRSEADLGKSKRGQGIARFLTPRGLRILDALDKVAARQDAEAAEVALAWLMARRAVTAPIASATSRAQVASFSRAAALILSTEDVAALDRASEGEPAAT